MGHMRNLRLGVLGASILSGASFGAQADGFDPRDGCFEVLVQASDADKVMIAAWSFGFLSARQGEARPVDTSNNNVILGNLSKACAGNPNLSVLELVQGSGQAPTSAQESAAPRNEANSEADAREMLMGFYGEGADLVALTAALKPSEADIRAVYAEPLASKLIAGYEALFTPGIKFGPKPKHNDLFVVRTTTAALKSGNAVLKEFPGGYGDVLPYMIGDFPIVRFKFITTGETLGLAFDGLIYINGRWVMMPKPWRYLE